MHCSLVAVCTQCAGSLVTLHFSVTEVTTLTLIWVAFGSYTPTPELLVGKREANCNVTPGRGNRSKLTLVHVEADQLVTRYLKATPKHSTRGSFGTLPREIADSQV